MHLQGTDSEYRLQISWAEITDRTELLAESGLLSISYTLISDRLDNLHLYYGA